MTNPPPPRYKVVERGRRLEVIDTRTGKPASSSSILPPPAQGGRAGDRLSARRQEGLIAAPPPVRASEARVAPAGLDDGNVFTTRRWYDDKAPRTITLNFTTRKRLDSLRFGFAIVAALAVALSVWWWPFFPAFGVAALATPGARKGLRVASTRWIDTLVQAA